MDVTDRNFKVALKEVTVCQASGFEVLKGGGHTVVLAGKKPAGLRTGALEIGWMWRR